MPDPLQLDLEQQAAAAIEPDERQIVLAPPGSGKTEVVAALIANLADEHGLSPADEMLAISFSRAAVGALRRRVPHGGGGPAVTVRTLDSLASRLLDELDENEDWRALDFDGRIRRATTLLMDDAESDDLGQLQHLIVDEVQDLVGFRAELVLAILDQLPPTAGFTLLGDPRQAVFNFQMKEDPEGLTSQEFLERAATMGDVERRELTGQYRARSREARGAAELSTRFGEGDDWVKEVRTFTSRLFLAGDVASLAAPVARWPGTTAFLCRTNGDALVVAAELGQSGLPTSVRAPAEDLPVAPWLARALGRSPDRITREAAISQLDGIAPMGAESAWRILKTMERDYRRSDHLDLRALARRISSGDVPAELVVEERPAVVSTIHRAKGLEFDNVVLVNPGDLLPGSADKDDAAVAYVALTRARDQVIGATCVRPKGLRTDPRTGRWILAGHQPWQTFGIEVRGRDTRTDEDLDVTSLAETLGVGDRIEATLDAARSTLEIPVYALASGGSVVARTTAQFGETLVRRIGDITRRRTTWPGLEGLTVQAVETLGDPEAGSPLRLGVRVGGLARLEWPTKRGDARA